MAATSSALNATSATATSTGDAPAPPRPRRRGARPRPVATTVFGRSGEILCRGGHTAPGGWPFLATATSACCRDLDHRHIRPVPSRARPRPALAPPATAATTPVGNRVAATAARDCGSRQCTPPPWPPAATTFLTRGHDHNHDADRPRQGHGNNLRRRRLCRSSHASSGRPRLTVVAATSSAPGNDAVRETGRRPRLLPSKLDGRGASAPRAATYLDTVAERGRVAATE